MQDDGMRRYSTTDHSEAQGIAIADWTGLVSYHSDNLRLWERDDEPTAGIAVRCKLIHDLIGEIPGQDQDHARLRLPNPVSRHDLEVRPGYIQAMLEHIKVSNIF